LEKHLIIGASDAGISAALRIKEIRPDSAVKVIDADYYPNFSICGLPFLISSEVSDWRKLAHRTIPEIEKNGIQLLLGKKIKFINPQKRIIAYAEQNGAFSELIYDRLLLATGGISLIPQIKGVENEGVFFLRWIGDGLKIQKYLSQHQVKSAAVIGGGYIGMEMADALVKRGIQVTVLEYAPSVLTTLDAELASYIKKELEKNDVIVKTHHEVKEIIRSNNGLFIINKRGENLSADLVIVAAGVKPNISIAATAGVALGISGAINVNRQMKTNLPDIYAAGDCAETWHRIMRKNVYLPLGSTSHKQGRIAGENMAGGDAGYEGSLGTQVVAVFNAVAAKTGLRETEAASAGFMPATAQCAAWDHKVYYPDARQIIIRITGDRQTGKLLGAQMVGHRSSQVAKRIDVLAAALYHGMKVADIDKLDLSYTPPLSTPWDPVQMAAHAWVKEYCSNSL